jgi:indolepyruvate ferredoxin oxidoreductase alpha subunit
MPRVYAGWSPNEKVALDVAVGAAYAGSRALAVMKHVGLNVAADSYFYASMTGMEAGLVIFSADDPSTHSSQNEQDNRHYAKFARMPCLDPADSQEAHDWAGVALDIGEQSNTPMLPRLATRISHSCGVVDPNGTRPPMTDREPGVPG